MTTDKKTKAEIALRELLDDYKGRMSKKIDDRNKLSLEISDFQKSIEKIEGLLKELYEGEAPEMPKVLDEVDISSLSVSDGAYYIIKAEGKPLNCAEIGRLLKAKGKVLKAKDRNLYNMVYSILARDDRFIRTRPGTYGLTEWGYIKEG